MSWVGVPTHTLVVQYLGETRSGPVASINTATAAEGRLDIVATVANVSLPSEQALSASRQLAAGTLVAVVCCSGGPRVNQGWKLLDNDFKLIAHSLDVPLDAAIIHVSRDGRDVSWTTDGQTMVRSIGGGPAIKLPANTFALG